MDPGEVAGLSRSERCGIAAEQGVCDPDILIEIIPSESPSAHAELNCGELLSRRCRQSGVIVGREGMRGTIKQGEHNLPVSYDGTCGNDVRGVHAEPRGARGEGGATAGRRRS